MGFAPAEDGFPRGRDGAFAPGAGVDRSAAIASSVAVLAPAGHPLADAARQRSGTLRIGMAASLDTAAAPLLAARLAASGADRVWLGLTPEALEASGSALFELVRRLALPVGVLLADLGEPAALSPAATRALGLVLARAVRVVCDDAVRAAALAALFGSVIDVSSARTVLDLPMPVAASVARLSFQNAPGAGALAALVDAAGLAAAPNSRAFRLDDNARALVLMGRATALDPAVRQLIAARSAGMIEAAWDARGQRFRAGFTAGTGWHDRTDLIDGVAEDTGLALWALGETVLTAPDAGLAAWARQRFDTVLATFTAHDNPRPLALAMLGALAVVEADPLHTEALALLDRGGGLLHALLEDSRRPDWAWFEAVLGSDNPRLSQALIGAGHRLGRHDWRDSGLSSLRFIMAQQRAASGQFRVIGSESPDAPHEALPFNQQPREAQATIEAACLAWQATGDARWLDHALAAWCWFLGGNDRGVVLGDFASGDCRDGITPQGAGEPGKAEAVLSFQLAWHALHAVFATRSEGAWAAPSVPRADLSDPVAFA